MLINGLDICSKIDNPDIQSCTTKGSVLQATGTYEDDYAIIFDGTEYKEKTSRSSADDIPYLSSE